MDGNHGTELRAGNISGSTRCVRVCLLHGKLGLGYDRKVNVWSVLVVTGMKAEANTEDPGKQRGG